MISDETFKTIQFMHFIMTLYLLYTKLIVSIAEIDVPKPRSISATKPIAAIADIAVPTPKQYHATSNQTSTENNNSACNPD